MKRAAAHRNRYGIVCCLLLLMPFPLAAKEPSPPPPTLPPPAAQASPPASAAVDSPQIAKTAPEVKLKSLFYSPDEVSRLHAALDIYRKTMAGKAIHNNELLSTLAGISSQTGQGRYYTYPQFFLSSLVYHTPDDWIVWVNGRKMTPDSDHGDTDLRVMEIDPDKVILEWTPVLVEKVLEIWALAPNESVTVDKREGTVTFTLRPNQTFSSYAMRVLEGKVKPVTVDTAVVTFKPPEEAAQPDGSGTGAAGPADNPSADHEQGQGLEGLLNLYNTMEKRP